MSKAATSSKDEKQATQKTDDQIGKQPQPQTVYHVSGNEVDSEINTSSTEEPQEVYLNHVGQKIDTPIEEHDAYLTPQGKTMFVQMEEDNQIFAGEHGKNAHWYPKKVVDTWTKIEKKKAPKTEKSDK